MLFSLLKLPPQSKKRLFLIIITNFSKFTTLSFKCHLTNNSFPENNVNTEI